MQLYHNIVKKLGEEYPSFFEGFSNHNLIFYGPQKLPLFLPLPKKIILLTLFLIWPLTTANYAENHTRNNTETKETAAPIAAKKPADSKTEYTSADGTPRTRPTAGPVKKAPAH